MGLNQCVLVGNVTRDPEFKTFDGKGRDVQDLQLATTGIAINGRNKENVQFITLNFWNGRSKVAEYVKKGDRRHRDQRPQQRERAIHHIELLERPFQSRRVRQKW